MPENQNLENVHFPLRVVESLLPEADVRGLIFDCDGTLADTMPAHYVAWQETLQPLGMNLPEEQFYNMGGTPTRIVAEVIVRQHGREGTISIDQLAIDKEARFLMCLSEVRPIEPVVAIVEQFYGKLPLAVGTGGMLRVCKQILEQIGIADRFQTIVAAEDVTRHKPAGDTFAEAARRIGVPAEVCLVYEDTNPGLEAARRAGMRVADVRRWHTPQRITG